MQFHNPLVKPGHGLSDILQDPFSKREKRKGTYYLNRNHIFQKFTDIHSILRNIY